MLGLCKPSGLESKCFAVLDKKKQEANAYRIMELDIL